MSLIDQIIAEMEADETGMVRQRLLEALDVPDEEYIADVADERIGNAHIEDVAYRAAQSAVEDHQNTYHGGEEEN